jgi:hypothetical protein
MQFTGALDPRGSAQRQYLRERHAKVYSNVEISKHWKSSLYTAWANHCEYRERQHSYSNGCLT